MEANQINPTRLSKEEEISRAIRLRTLNIFTISGVIFFLVFAHIYLLVLDNPLGWGVEILITLILMTNLIFVRKTKNVDLASTVVIFALIPFYIFIINTGGIAQTGLFWLHPFPIVAFYFKGKKYGSYWSIVLLAYLVVLFTLKQFDIHLTPLDPTPIRQATMSYILMVIFIYSYANAMEKKEEIIKNSATKLNKLNSTLTITNKKLKKQYKESQDRTEELEKINKLTVGRELRMTELKKEIEELKSKLKKSNEQKA